MIPPFETPLNLWLLLREVDAVPAGRGANGLDVAKAVEAGLPIALFGRLLERRVLESADVPLVMSMRTFHHRKAARSRLTTAESDRLVRIIQLTAAASGALGSMERGMRWLRTPNFSLRGLRPLDWVKTSAGMRVVEELLGRVDHGIGF